MFESIRKLMTGNKLEGGEENDDPMLAISSLKRIRSAMKPMFTEDEWEKWAVCKEEADINQLSVKEMRGIISTFNKFFTNERRIENNNEISKYFNKFDNIDKIVKGCSGTLEWYKLILPTGTGKSSIVPIQLAFAHATIGDDVIELPYILCSQPRTITCTGLSYGPFPSLMFMLKPITKESEKTLGKPASGFINFMTGGSRTKKPEDKEIVFESHITFVTEGLMLTTATSKKKFETFLSRFNYVLIDEVHEMTNDMNFLMSAILMTLSEMNLKGRAGPKILIMTATPPEREFENFTKNGLQLIDIYDGYKFLYPKKFIEVYKIYDRIRKLIIKYQTFFDTEDDFVHIMSRMNEMEKLLYEPEKWEPSIDAAADEIRMLSSIKKGEQLKKYLLSLKKRINDDKIIPEQRGETKLKIDEYQQQCGKFEKEEYINGIVNLIDDIMFKNGGRIVSTSSGAGVPSRCLVFLHSTTLIKKLSLILKQRFNGDDDVFNKSPDKILILQIYRDGGDKDRLGAIGDLPKEKKFIVVATDIAETGVTLKGLDLVIDPLIAKSVRYNPIISMPEETVKRLNQSRRTQRKGRTGRDKAGAYFEITFPDVSHQQWELIDKNEDYFKYVMQYAGFIDCNDVQFFLYSFVNNIIHLLPLDMNTFIKAASTVERLSLFNRKNREKYLLLNSLELSNEYNFILYNAMRKKSRALFEMTMAVVFGLLAIEDDILPFNTRRLDDFPFKESVLTSEVCITIRIFLSIVNELKKNGLDITANLMRLGVEDLKIREQKFNDVVKTFCEKTAINAEFINFILDKMAELVLEDEEVAKIEFSPVDRKFATVEEIEKEIRELFIDQDDSVMKIEKDLGAVINGTFIYRVQQKVVRGDIIPLLRNLKIPKLGSKPRTELNPIIDAALEMNLITDGRYFFGIRKDNDKNKLFINHII